MYARRAEFYETEYAEVRDIAFLSGLLKNSRHAVLEVPCGAGRLTLHLADKVKDYTIADREPRMISATLTQLEQSLPHISVSAHICDMTNLSLKKRFDWIICPRESLQLIAPEKLTQTLAHLCQHLKPAKGTLLIDMASFSQAGDPDYFYKSNSEHKWIKNWTRKNAENRLLTRCSLQTETADKIDFHFTYEMQTVEKRWQFFSSQMRLFKYDPETIRACLPDEHVICSLAGNYDGKAWQKGDAWLIFQIRKKATGHA